MYYHYDIETQIKRIFKRFNENDLTNSNDRNDQNLIIDFFDGDLYKDLLASENGESFRKKESLTFLFNTDGITRSDKSNQTIWPILIVINELPIQERFCIDNIIIAGLSVGLKKPDIPSFLSPIVPDIKSLEFGLQVEFKNKEITRKKFYLISSVFDKPARAEILNMQSYNGFYGCLKCYQTGETLKCNSSNSS